MSQLDTSDKFPWNQMELRTFNGYNYVFIPNIWVKNEGNGGQGTLYTIHEEEVEGSHIHPAFVTNGEVNPTGILISEDIVGGGQSYTDLLTAAAQYGTGVLPYNIYDHHLIARLMLIEYESADLQTLITGSNGGMGATYHGIKNVWGGTSKGFWIYGLDTSNSLGINNTNIHILSSDMDGTMVDTGITPCGGGYPVTFLMAKGTKFDPGDVFLAATVDNSPSNGSCGDYQYLITGNAFHTDYSTSDAGHGPFHLRNDVPSRTASWLGFRLRKAV